MQDESKAERCFSYKMSLKEGFRMLGIDHQHGSRRTTEPGTDPGLCGSQRRDAFSFPGPTGVVRVGESDLGPAGLQPPQAPRQRTGAALPGPDDRFEPGAGDAPDWVLPARRRSE